MRVICLWLRFAMQFADVRPMSLLLVLKGYAVASIAAVFTCILPYIFCRCSNWLLILILVEKIVVVSLLDHFLKGCNKAEVKPLGNASLMTTSEPLTIQKGQPLHYLYVRGPLSWICFDEAGFLLLVAISSDYRHLSTISGNLLERAALWSLELYISKERSAPGY